MAALSAINRKQSACFRIHSINQNDAVCKLKVYKMSETFGRESLNRENSSYIIIIDEIGGRVCRRFLVLLFF